MYMWFHWGPQLILLDSFIIPINPQTHLQLQFVVCVESFETTKDEEDGEGGKESDMVSVKLYMKLGYISN